MANPREVSEQERWIAKNRVVGVSVEYVQTGTDTAATYVTLTPDHGKPVRWLDSTFRQVARLTLGHASLAEPNYGIADAVKARESFERANANDLATYRRLQAKFGGNGNG